MVQTSEGISHSTIQLQCCDSCSNHAPSFIRSLTSKLTHTHMHTVSHCLTSIFKLPWKWNNKHESCSEVTADTAAQITTMMTELTFSQQLCSLQSDTGYAPPHNPQNYHTWERREKPTCEHFWQMVKAVTTEQGPQKKVRKWSYYF